MADIVYPGITPEGTAGSGLLPRILDLRIYQGDDFDLNYEFQDATGVVINLTGYVGAAHFRRDYTDTNPIVATVTISPDGLLLTMSLSSAQTSVMNGDYIYDLQLTSPSGKKRTYVTGDVIVDREVTR